MSKAKELLDLGAVDEASAKSAKKKLGSLSKKVESVLSDIKRLGGSLDPDEIDDKDLFSDMKKLEPAATVLGNILRKYQ